MKSRKCTKEVSLLYHDFFRKEIAMGGTLNWGEKFLNNEEGEVTCPIMFDGDYRSVSYTTWEQMEKLCAE